MDSPEELSKARLSLTDADKPPSTDSTHTEDKSTLLTLFIFFLKSDSKVEVRLLVSQPPCVERRCKKI